MGEPVHHYILSSVLGAIAGMAVGGNLVVAVLVFWAMLWWFRKMDS